MTISNLIKILEPHEIVGVVDNSNNQAYFKLINKHHQVARCIVVVNDNKPNYFRFTDLESIKNSEITSLSSALYKDKLPILCCKIK